VIYLNAVLFAAFATFFSWEEDHLLHGGELWQIIGAGVGGLLALYLLLSTVRQVYQVKR